MVSTLGLPWKLRKSARLAEVQENETPDHIRKALVPRSVQSVELLALLALCAEHLFQLLRVSDGARQPFPYAAHLLVYYGVENAV